MSNSERYTIASEQLASSAGVEQLRAHTDSLWRAYNATGALSDDQLAELIEIAQKALFELLVCRKVQSR